MLQFPPLPGWESLHPLAIHFPIVLLLLSPLFVLISAALPPPKGRPYMSAALLVLLLGTASVFVASSTGKAASDLEERTAGAMKPVLESHEYLASETEVVFTGLSAILTGMLVLPRVLRRQETRLFSTLLPLTFLALYSVGVVFLVNTAHAGGRLVHEFGLHAVMPVTTGQASSVVAGSPTSEAK
jgi:uncharacterized membrane protein